MGGRVWPISGRESEEADGRECQAAAGRERSTADGSVFG